MKGWIFFASLYLIFQVGYGQVSQKLSVTLDHAPLRALIDTIETKSPYRFYYLSTWIDTVQVSVRATDALVNEILARALRKSQLYFFITDKKIILTQGIQLTDDIDFRNGTVTLTSENQQQKFLREIPTQVSDKKEEVVKEIGKRGASPTKEGFNLSGYVREKRSGEPLTGVLIHTKGLKNAVTSDQFGFYSITLPPGENTLELELVGMKPVSQKINLLGKGNLDFTMQESITELKEVVIESDGDLNISNVQMGVSRIDVKSIKNIPKVVGENDILKVATSLPGVKTVGEGASGINVRGGHADQNLVILNEATIYNTSHFLGFFSVFNPDAIRSFELYKTGMPVQFGGRLSSAFELLMRDGNQKKFSGEGGIGPITSQLTLEGPLIKDKTSIMAGGRSTYSNWVLRALPQTVIRNTRADFYDYFARITHTANSRNTFYLSLYSSNDKFNLSSDSVFSYSNKLASLQWRHVFNPSLDALLSVTHSEYKYKLNFDKVPVSAFNLGFDIKESNVKWEFNKTVGTHKLTYGVQSKLYELNPGFYDKGNEASLIEERNVSFEKGIESAVFLSDNIDVSENFSIYYGLRYSFFSPLGSRTIYRYEHGVSRSDNSVTDTLQYGANKIVNTFHGPEYRFSARYKLTRESALKASYNKTRQYIHMLSNTVSVSPTDTWKLSDPNVLPQIADQVSMGFYKDLKKDVFEFSTEVYYKWIQNILDYRTGASLLVNEKIDQDILQGKGKAYGVELLLRKKSGKLTGWLGYSYSRTFIQLGSGVPSENINNGKYFPANYDKPHDINVITNYKITRRYSFSYNFAYSTGRPITYPINVYRFGNAYRINYEDRNSSRIPNYIRMDLGFNIEGNHKIKKLAHSYWTVSIYNLLGRKNPYSVYFRIEEEKIKAYRLSIFGAPIPTVTYHFKF